MKTKPLKWPYLKICFLKNEWYNFKITGNNSKRFWAFAVIFFQTSCRTSKGECRKKLEVVFSLRSKCAPKLKIAENMQFYGTYQINLISSKNIDMGRNGSLNTNYSIYGHKFFGHNSAICWLIGLNFLWELLRPLSIDLLWEIMIFMFFKSFIFLSFGGKMGVAFTA